MSSANDIVMENELGDELPFTKVDNDECFLNKKKYKEVFFSEGSLILGNVTQGFLQVANQAMTLSAIASQAPNGLFTSTVDATKLSKFKNGTFTTMVHKSSGKIEKHAGFTKVGLNQSMNPAMALSAGMQVMSMVSGTYYLHQMNVQLSSINDKLEELLQIHHDVNIGKLITAKKGLSEIAEREFVDMVDINSIRAFKKTVDEIQEEYAYSLHRKEKQLLSGKEIDQKKLKAIQFYMSLIFEASKISLLAEAIEIGTRMKIGNQTEIIDSLTQQLNKSYKNSFYYNSDAEYDKLLERVKNKIIKKLDKQKQNSDKMEDFISKIPNFNSGITTGKKAASSVISAKDTLDSTKTNKKIDLHKIAISIEKNKTKQDKSREAIGVYISEILELPYKEVEFIYIPDGKSQRVFIPA